MRLWELPGAKRFVDRTCDHLRGGSSVVVRFPGAVPEGFNAAVAARLGNALEVGRLSVTDSPLHDLARRYAEHPRHIGRLPDLCDDPGFRGQLVRPEGLDATTWPAWRRFLHSYAEASRSRPLLGRSLFLVLLAGSPPAEPPTADIGLVNHAWDGVLDDVDLLLFATERLRGREDNPLVRSLLATTVARVAAWDFDTAAVLLDEDNGTILDPGDLLRAVANDKGWTASTPLDWRIGTSSRTGIAHPARVALDDPPAELDRRLWSAQLSVLLPWIEARRHETVIGNLFEVRRQMHADGNHHRDALALELGDLVRLFGRRGADRQVRRTFERLRDGRNELAHRRHLSHSTILDLIAVPLP